MPVCEDLATKAELQELRDQLNAIFNSAIEGGTGTNIDVFSQGNLNGTQIAGGVALAATSIQALTIEGATGGALWQNLANGTATISQTLGNGTKAAVEGLRNFGGTVGKTTLAGIATIALMPVAASVVSIVTSLASTIASTGLTIATIEILGNRIDINENAIIQFNKDYTSLINLLSQQNADILEATNRLEDNEEAFEDQKAETLRLATELRQANEQILGLENIANTRTTELNDLVAQVNAANQSIANLEANTSEEVSNLQENVNQMIEQINVGRQLVTDLQETATKLQNRITLMEEIVQKHEARITELEIISTYWRGELIQLRVDTEENIDLLDARVDLLEAKVILAENKTRTVGGSGGSVAAKTAVANAQTKVLELASNLAGTTTQTPTITNTDIENGTTTFSDTFTDLLSQIDTTTMDETQYNNLVDTLTNNFDTVLAGTLGATVIPNLDILKSQTSQTSIANAAATGVCSTTQPGGCMTQNVTDPINSNLNNYLSGAGAGIAAANNALNQQILANTNAIKTITQVTQGITQTTLNIISHAQTGLEATSNFVQTAWKATHADKVLTAINTGLLVHNAIMLSNNVAQTIGDTASVVLNAVGIKDETDNPIDVNEFIRNKMNAFFTSILGAENYATVKERLAKANRIYQATANVANIIRDLTESARSIAEMAASNTGKIGNALLEAGVVFDDAYDEMVESVRPQSAWQYKFEQFREGLDTVEDGVSTVGNIAGEAVNVKEQFTELKEAKDNWQTEVNTAVDELKQERATDKDSSLVKTDIDSIDFTRNESTN